MIFERSTSAPPMLWQESSKNKLVQRHIPSLKNESQELPSLCYKSISLVEDDENTVEDSQEKPIIKCDEEQFQLDLDRALYLSRLDLQRYSQQESFTSLSKGSYSIMSYNPNSSIANKSLKYHDNFHKMNRDQKINILFLNTYQVGHIFN